MTKLANQSIFCVLIVSCDGGWSINAASPTCIRSHESMVAYLDLSSSERLKMLH